MKIYSLHGFLGMPQDWSRFQKGILKKCFHSTDLYDKKFPNPSEGMWSWARHFNKECVHEKGKILLGYSLGGRLAMHSLLDDPDQWLGGIIVSANPGLPSLEKRKERLLRDERWAKKFEIGNWSDLMASWNSQDALKDTFQFQRREKDYNRSYLSDSLSYWSLGRQENLLERLKDLKIPLLWVVGENDAKYLSILVEIKSRCPNIKTAIIPKSGHRCLWESPHEFMKLLREFLVVASLHELS